VTIMILSNEVCSTFTAISSRSLLSDHIRLVLVFFEGVFMVYLFFTENVFEILY
jgi:hypothetical protein